MQIQSGPQHFVLYNEVSAIRMFVKGGSTVFLDLLPNNQETKEHVFTGKLVSRFHVRERNQKLVL